MSVSNKDLASLIIDFVQGAVNSKAVAEDYLESMDVVISCLSDAFEIDADEASGVVSSKFQGKNLQQLVQSALSSGASSSSSSSSSKEDSSVPVNISADETERKAKAEALKAEGNKVMAAQDFEAAIAKYTQAIEVLDTNAVYYSNRAAAYSSVGKHNLAIKDANKAIELDPQYARAYSRLGLANYALGDVKAALQAYEKGLEIEGDKPSPGMKKGFETAKKRVIEEEAAAAGSGSVDNASATRSQPSGGMPDLGGLASMLGGGAGGGMPDLGGLMSNPQVMQAAQQMMQNPDAMANLMNNPMLQQMASSFGLGGGAGARSGASEESGASGSGGQPSMDDLMNNPMLRNLADSFMNNRNSGNGGN
ncbi:Sgt2 protein [Saccharomycopsis crataegensis]|uniref:Sgt2 protein n=1 Tax=Saccharomycopsis crataegensis TaxID=43959 RepID=A0AAV5QPS9_9ASCO|nr:Sgt2 protein [Saccharomycopsis crataegensis]